MIPKLHYISQGNSPQEHLDNIQNSCTSGIELVQLDLKNLSEKKYLKFASSAREITSHFQTRLLIRDNYKIAKAVKADGVHLGKTGPCPSVARKHIHSWQIVGGTANSFQDCETLLDKQVNYIYLGPFRETANKENIPSALDLKGFTAITDVLKTGTPILGFGGITTKDVVSILKTGVSGVAVSEEITQKFNTIRTFHQLLDASSTAEQRHTFQ